MRMGLLALLLAFAASSLPGQARADTDRGIFLAEVRSILLTRDDGQQPPNEGGDELIALGCGSELVTFQVVRSVSAMLSPINVQFSVGEFCHPPVDFDAGQLLIVFREGGPFN